MKRKPQGPQGFTGETGDLIRVSLISVSPSWAFDGYLPVGIGGGTPPRSNGIMGLGRNSRQIFGFKGLRGKIFRNKELAGYSVASIVPLPLRCRETGTNKIGCGGPRTLFLTL